MKKLRFSLGLFLFSLSIYSQIGFDEHTIMENVNFAQNVNSIANGDIDGDGDKDLISADDGRIKWFENTDGNNTHIIQHNIGNFLGKKVFLADIDSDSDLDVVVYGVTQVFWFENTDGLGNFGNKIVLDDTIDTLKAILDVAISDLDSDGDEDIIISHNGTSGNPKPLYWLENDGNANFTEHTIATYAYDTSISVADINADNTKDIITTYQSGGVQYIRIYSNDGNQNFTTQAFVNDSGTSQLRLSDVDNDNDFDIITTTYYGQNLILYKNNGYGIFASEAIPATNLNDISYINVSDLDSDGDMDILFTSFNDDTVAWLENTNGLGNFDNQTILNSNANGANCIIAYDYNNDGFVDVLSSSKKDDKISWYKNNSNINFDSEIILTSSINRVRSIAADIDGDGDNDVISYSLADEKITWYKNNDGLGDFGNQKLIYSDVSGSIHSIAVKDLDNDGDMDIVIGEDGSSSGSILGWVENLDGQGNFGELQILDSDTSGVKSVLIEDLDNDGDNDVIFSQWNSNIFWVRNNGDGTFSPTISIDTYFYATVYDIEIKDMDNDGNKDIIASTVEAIKWFKNDGNENFTLGDDIMNFSSGAELIPLNVVDIDGDNDFDVVTARRISTVGMFKIIWFENLDGLGNYNGGSHQIATDVHQVTNIATGDVDGDGDFDVVSGSHSKVAWYENTNNDGIFGSENIIYTNTTFYNFVSLSDINGNGKQDIINSTSEVDDAFDDDKILWFENLGFLTNKISGLVNLDVDNNGCDSSNTLPIPDLLITTQSGTETLSTFTLSNGYYQLFPELGNYTTTITSNLPNYYTANPASYLHNFTDVGNTETANFCLQPNQIVNDLNISIIPLNVARPGFDASYQIVYKNVGTTQLSGNINFEYDNTKLAFLTANQTIASQTANSILFNYTDINPFETRTIMLNFNVLTPPVVNIDDILDFTASINPTTGDITPEDNVYELQQTVVGSYDPNDISVAEGEQILLADADKYLHYIIRFQNTGTAYAQKVRIHNILDDKLDWTTLQLESSSHDNTVEIKNGSEIDFIFNAIYLPDSTTDEPNSHGYIAYKIKPKDNVSVGDVFVNNAAIYFDFNTAINTNTVTTEIVNTLSLNDNNLLNFTVYPVPTTDILKINTKSQVSKIEIYNKLGQLVIENTEKNTINISNLNQGLYFVKVTDINSISNTKKIVKK